MSAAPLSALPAGVARGLTALLTDIAGTMTDPEGRIPASSFDALERARGAGLRTVVVTGRPAGWCDLIARTWPVDGVVGENGGLAFWRDERQLQRHFLQDAETRRRNRERLAQIRREVLEEVPGCRIASDQPYRELDLAVDFAEDTGPLDDAAIDAIVAVFERHGAHAKVSNIHVNGWFGEFDKLRMCREVLRRWWSLDPDERAAEVLFLGDSPNDEPMFAAFPHTIGMANVRRFLPRMQHPPAYVASGAYADGFAEAVARVADLRKIC